MTRSWGIDDLAEHLGVDPKAEPATATRVRTRRTGKRRHSSGLRAVKPEREVPAYIRQLRVEEPSAKGEGRSGQTFHLVLSGLEAGFSDEEILWLAERHGPSVDKYGDDLDIEVERIIDKHRGDHDHVGTDCLEADCESAPEWLRARRRLADVRRFAEAHDWCYLGGPTDRLVLGHLLDVAERAGTATVSASVRDVAKKINRTKDTVSRSLRRLQGTEG